MDLVSQWIWYPNFTNLSLFVKQNFLKVSLFSVISISVVNLTLHFINSEAAIPAKPGIQLGKTGFGVKPGMTIKVNPVRNSSGALNPAGIIIKPNPAAEPCTSWCTGQSSRPLFLTG